VAGSHTLHQDGNVRIYSLHGHAYACSSRYGRKVFLTGTAGVLNAYTQVKQTILAFAVESDGSITETFASRNLKTGAVLHRTVDACGTGYPCGPVYRMVTNSTGAFAWIIFTSVAENGFTEVWEDGAGGAKQLDHENPMGCGDAPITGCDTIDTGYLRAASGKVFWKNQNGIQSAPLS
jgi:hypothetical protein